MASGSHDGTVKIWDIGIPSKPITTFIQHDAPVTCMKYNPVDKALASGGNDRIIKYWDLDSYSMVNLIYNHSDHIYETRCNTDPEFGF